MAKEILAVPEEHMRDVIRVIRMGLSELSGVKPPLDPEVVEQLTKWCDEGSEYLDGEGGEP